MPHGGRESEALLVQSEGLECTFDVLGSVAMCQRECCSSLVSAACSLFDSPVSWKAYSWFSGTPIF